MIRGQALMAEGMFASGEFFEVAGLSSHAGRLLAKEDDQPGAPPAAVVSYRLWKERFAGQLTAVSEKISINGNPFTVIGVTPPEFIGIADGRPDFFVSVAAQPLVMPRLQGRDPNLFWLQLVARKRPETTREQAQVALNSIFQQNLPWQDMPVADRPVLEADPGSRGYEFVRWEYEKPLWMLMTLVSLLLLIACTNVANLLLARGAARSGESAVRAALGAGRMRLLRQHLTESVLIAVLGGVGGLLCARWGRDFLVAAATASMSRLSFDARLDWRVFGFTLAVSLACGILFGLVPAWRASHTDPAPSLQLGTRMTPGGGKGPRLLVLLQVAVSLILLVAAGLFQRNLRQLQNTRLGFNPENLLLFRVNALQAGHKGDDLIRFYRSMTERISTLPGVRSATYANLVLIGGGSWSTNSTRIQGQPVFERDLRRTLMLAVGPDYLRTMEIPMLLGRTLNERDESNGPKVAVVNERFVRQYLPNLQPVGQKFILDRRTQEGIEIVGVCANARYNTLRGDDPAIAYLSYAQQTQMMGSAYFSVRGAANPEALVPSVRQVVRSLDPNLPLSDIKTQAGQMNEFLRQERLFALLTGAFGALAAMLAAIGLYGVMAYAVSRRTAEIGVRIALGATRRDIGWLVLKDVCAVATWGVAMGVAGAVAGSTLVESSLYKVAATDPPTIAVAAAVMAAVAMAAGYIPARRAARLDPMIALRHE